MSTTLKHIITANILAPIVVWVFLETANLPMNANNLFAFGFVACLLFTNIYHAKNFDRYRTINVLLFLLNGLSLFLAGEISFVTGLYIGTLWLVSVFM